MREVIIYRGEDNYWITECPSLPGCISQGKTKEAIEGYIAVLKDDGIPVPPENFEAFVVAV